MPEDITIGADPVAAAPASDAAASEAAAQAAAAEADPFDNAEVQQFDRTYVQKLRDEAAKHRTDKKKFEDAFTGWEGEDADVWLDVIKAAADPNSKGSAAETLRKIADLLAPGDPAKPAAEAAAQAAEAAEGADAASKPLTQADIDRIFAEREAQAQQDAALKAIKDEAKELGYEERTADYAQLMFYANFETKGDLKAAHEKIQANRQAVIDEYVRTKAADANLPTGGTGGGFHVSDEKKPKTISEASDALLAMLKSNPAE